MKLEIYGEDRKDEVVRLKLVREFDEVVLVAVDAAGDLVGGGFILNVTKAGTVKMRLGVNRVLGFQQDKNGEVKVEHWT